MTSTIRVPLTRFKRELRKWMRVIEEVDVIVTKRDVDFIVAVGHERMPSFISPPNSQETESF